ncbi:lipid A biosynthesis acyltransferase [Flammeovirgaceae bacterium 311]|nr:lipid A biosynthesis acyltransferase [Flammeovirgaceae bacterium 311]
MSSWKGKTRGGLLGYKIFIFVLRRLGLRAAYALLRVVAAYFVVFAPTASKSMWVYFRDILGYPTTKALAALYQNYYVFGQTLLDKVALMAGLKTPFTYTFEGEEHLRNFRENNTGGILISAHLGNWEVAGFLLKRLDMNINIVMFEAEHEKIKEYLGQVMQNRNINIIPVKQDLSHIFLINKAIRNKEVICMHGDRFVEGGRVASVEFMGRKANFPLGPFTLAAKLGVPYTFVYAVKSSETHYHLSATPQQQSNGRPYEILEAYTASLECKVRQYPLQWFNYYRFWSEDLKGGTYEQQQHEVSTHS